VLLRALLILPGLLLAQSDLGFPAYTTAGIANTAANVAGLYAPNTLITIYGVNLAFSTHPIGLADLRNGNLPTSLGFPAVRVLLDGNFANLYYVSPTQVNALIPPHLRPGPVTLQVVNSGRAGPPARIMLEESAPGLFEDPAHFVIATHGNGPVVTEAAPAQGGEVVVLYATGLGPTTVQPEPNHVPTAAVQITNFSAFQVWLNGAPAPPDHILYAGVTPGFGGLFQINLQLPQDSPRDPEVRVGTPARMSPPGTRLHVRP
jgi:uncharacterized protein (TIGR03437 family)